MKKFNDDIEWGAFYDEYDDEEREKTKKERALDMYDELSNDSELLYELNILLRKDKLKELQNGQNKEIK